MLKHFESTFISNTCRVLLKMCLKHFKEFIVAQEQLESYGITNDFENLALHS